MQDKSKGSWPKANSHLTWMFMFIYIDVCVCVCLLFNDNLLQGRMQIRTSFQLFPYYSVLSNISGSGQAEKIITNDKGGAKDVLFHEC